MTQHAVTGGVRIVQAAAPYAGRRARLGVSLILRGIQETLSRPRSARLTARDRDSTRWQDGMVFDGKPSAARAVRHQLSALVLQKG